MSHIQPRWSPYRQNPRRPRVTRRRWEQLAFAVAVTALITAAAALILAVRAEPSSAYPLVCGQVLRTTTGLTEPVLTPCRVGTRP